MLSINLLDIPPDGLQVESEVESSVLALSPGDGTINFPLMCSGFLSQDTQRTFLFQGIVSGRMTRECVRCLGKFEDPVKISCEAIFRESSPKNPGMVAGGRKKAKQVANFNEDGGEEDTYQIDENQIDLLLPIREQLILASPLQALCREECLGLCQVCGGNLNEQVCACCSPVSVSPLTTEFDQSLMRH